MMAPIIDASLSRARTVISILVLLLLSGGFSYVNIPKESSPDIDIPQIYVSAYLEGISPEDSERLIIRPLEQELASIEGVKLKINRSNDLAVDSFKAGLDRGRTTSPPD